MRMLALVFSLSSAALVAQAQTSAPIPDRPPTQELTPQVLGEMLRTATTFHDLVTRLDVTKSLGPDQHVLGPDGQFHHSLQRTAAAIGAGAGAGAAIGGMKHSPNAVFIGAILGSAGGAIVDQIIRHREEMRDRAAFVPAPGPPPPPRELHHRYRDDRRIDPLP